MKLSTVYDEEIMISQELHPLFKSFHKKKKKITYENIYFSGDSSFLCDYLLSAVSKANTKFPVFKRLAFVADSNLNEKRASVLKDNAVPSIFFDKVNYIQLKKSLFFYFIDCEDISNKKQTLQNLLSVLKYMKTDKTTRCIISVMLPDFPHFNGSATSLAERELSFFLEKVCERTPGIQYYLDIEKLCRENVRESELNVSLLRFDNVFAPDSFHTHKFSFDEILKESDGNKKITINDDDFRQVFSLSYVRDACFNIFYSAFYAKKGHIYNISSCEVSVADIKEYIFNSHKKSFSLDKHLSSNAERTFYSLNCLKFNSLGVNATIDLCSAVKHVVSYLTECEFDISENISFYSGRIEQIQALEIEMLKEIDRICVANDIKYFLAGGSLLGAVRSGGVIPWDDDLDIGMLRKDYDKFRKVCETQFSDKFSYSSPFNGSASHYTTEKVRLESTYFSTKYSSENVFSDGVFIDVLIYDQTSNIKLFQKIHTTILAILYDCIILRWNYLPWKNSHHGIVKVIVPFLKLLPWGFYHRLFEFFAKFYKNKKNAKWLIDTVGKKLKHGPLPKKGLEDIVYVDFNGIKAPIPVDYTGYLNYAYGADYMNRPNFGNRCCPHNFARIDLGKYIFDKTGSTPFRDVEVFGELFESEEEK